MSIIDKLANRRILIVGDVILDHYLIGKADRISPEAPVMVIAHEQEDYRLGGAANVALNVRAMDARPYLVAVVGNDFYGRQLEHLLAEQGISAAHLIHDESRPTTIKTRVLARHQQLLRYDRESTAAIAPAIEQKIVETIADLCQREGIETIVFQDYNKGVLTLSLIAAVLKIAQQHNIATITDPKKDNFWAYKGVTLFKPNLREVNEGIGANLSERKVDLDELNTAAQRIQHQLNNTYTCITLGAKGIFVQTPQGHFHVPTRERAVADVCGAGDTVVSLLALGLAARLDMQQTVQLANLAGGQVCEKIGVVPVDKTQLTTEFESESNN